MAVRRVRHVADFVESAGVGQLEPGVPLQKLGPGDHRQRLRLVVGLRGVGVGRGEGGGLSRQREAAADQVPQIGDRGLGDHVGGREGPGLDRLGGARDDVGLVVHAEREPVPGQHRQRGPGVVHRHRALLAGFVEGRVVDVDLDHLRPGRDGRTEHGRERCTDEGGAPRASGERGAMAHQLQPQPPPLTEPPPKEPSRFSSTC